MSFLLMAYLFHYIPFWLMGRSKFLHHYMPALILKYCFFGCVFELILTILMTPNSFIFVQLLKSLPLLNDHQNPIQVLWKTKNSTVYYQKPFLRKLILLILLIATVIATVSCYLYFSPMTYAFPLTPQQIKNRKFQSSWDFQYSAK
eukprot:NODE_411_length_7931_cov_0.531920.p7 type:complete len:146 gc:universal NODE_411_length_7931_cov_0.531920:6983-7420(+)